MYKSIIEFIEKGTIKIEKITKESLLSGNMMCFEEELIDTVLEFDRSLYQEILESIEQTIRNSEVRKQSYYVEHKEDHRTLLTRFGNIEITRAYYLSKQDRKGIYLLDKYVGLDSNEKVSLAAKAQRGNQRALADRFVQRLRAHPDALARRSLAANGQ